MPTYKHYLEKSIGKILTNETEINIKLKKINHKLLEENILLKNELNIIKHSHYFKLWPLYCYIKNILHR